MVKFVKNRVEEIMQKNIFNDKSVLEIGCVGKGRDDEIGGENWLHGRIAKTAKRVVGVDINKEGVKKLNKKGYNIIQQNAEKPFNLKEKFDVIIAARILEHLQNPGIFMQNVHKHLKKGGLFLVITPNTNSVSFFLQSLIKGKADISKEHMHWHDVNTLKNFLETNGFDILHMDYSHPRPVFKKFLGYFVQTFWTFLPKQMGRQIFCLAKLKDGKKI